ncbi:delta(14)-sterol reductase LBR-like [Saccoglossus kowalevskii]|uniref:Lamin-B receptor-like n=1 Tax=Saccoglossus kowalevskii TaxID=10224 RepID=A0ABM0GRT1_SACKO|nr:PREDICTED: lamin-B receptor-like [Saccoglossus kowalevskii]
MKRAREMKAKSAVVAKTTEYEFMGPVGAVLMVFGLPVTVYYLYFACQPRSCTVLNLAVIPTDVTSYIDKDATLVVLGWFVFQSALYMLPVGRQAQGLPLKSGKRLTYRINAFFAMIVSFITFGFAVYYKYMSTFLYDKYLHLATAAMIFALMLSVFLYIKAKLGPQSALCDRGNSGYFFYDFFMGHELNPRIGSFDLKFFCELRPGLIGWVLLNFGMVAKVCITEGKPSAGIILVSVFQAWYVIDGLWHEECILTTMDIVHDGFGFMLAFGDLVWVPFTYSLQTRYLVDHPLDLSYISIAAIIAIKLAGYAIFRGSNSQKDCFRRNPHDPKLQHLKSISTDSGSRLLISGWWGMVRHPNYFGDILMSIAWSLPCGFSSVLPWFYPIYFTILLIHREQRDSHQCQKKYGKDWTRYCQIVKYRIFPYIY